MTMRPLRCVLGWHRFRVLVSRRHLARGTTPYGLPRYAVETVYGCPVCGASWCRVREDRFWRLEAVLQRSARRHGR